MHPALRCSLAVLIGLGTCASTTQTLPAQQVRWYSGVEAPLPKGALLTGNPGYWGEMVDTHVTYSYVEAPNNPADILKRDANTFGNRLLDGRPIGDWHSPVGMNRKPLVVDFDFHQDVTLNQVAVAQFQGTSLKLAEVEVKRDGQEWRKVLSVNASAGPLHQLVLPQPESARFVRLRLQSDATTTYISQVWMWGEAAAQPTASLPHGFFPEINSFTETRDAAPGDATVLPPPLLAQWQQAVGDSAKTVTWVTAPGWQMQRKNPLQGVFLPGKAALRKPVAITTTRNETEPASLFLVNTTGQPQEMQVELSDFRNAQGQAVDTIGKELSVAGAIWTRRWGHTLRPLFSAQNKLGSVQMQKYLTNSEVIKDFPKLHLPPGGTALLWITVTVNNALPGQYTATLKDGRNSIPVQLTVLPQTLPSPNVWLRSWGSAPASTRNLWSNPQEIGREVAYMQSLGITVWQGWPAKDSHVAAAREAAKAQGRPIYYVVGASAKLRDAGYTGKLDPEKFDDAFKQQVRDEALQMVATARSLGLDYADWSVELWDEPTPRNMKSWAAVARLFKEADPKIQLYMNPLFWTREGTNPAGFVSDERQVQELDGWYNELVDISVPILGQVNSQRYPKANELFYNHQPRRVRAYFIHPNPGRMLSWNAFERDYNGWGAYAYFAPRRDAWNDFDDREFDYQIVYPGPNGFIPTIESESMRESWDDYRLLTLLQQQGKTAMVDQLKEAYATGLPEIPAEETPVDRDNRSAQIGLLLPQLREKMMQAIAQ